MSNSNSKIGTDLQMMLDSLSSKKAKPQEKKLWELSRDARAARVAAGLYATKGGNQRDMRAKAKAKAKAS